jgi:hypothetical protein
MKMNKEEFEKLMLRFALELSEVGVTEDQIKRIHDSLDRTPNLASCNNQEVVSRFTYRHNEHMIEAKTTVELTVKRCK